ncbi:hypothetical protein D3C77_710560 [compost metagenome]
MLKQCATAGLKGLQRQFGLDSEKGAATGLGYRIGGTHLLAGREAYIPEALISTICVEETIGDLPQR